MKKPFSVQEWVNVPSKKDTPPNVAVPKVWNNTSSTADDVERIIRMIEAKRVDIAPSYEQWVKVGFAFCSEFGKNGRGYFNRISQFHPDVTQKAIDKQYNKCLSNKRSGVTIATFFQLAKDAGIDISKPKKVICQEPVKEKKPNGSLAFWHLQEKPLQLLLEYKPTLSETQKVKDATSLQVDSHRFEVPEVLCTSNVNAVDSEVKEQIYDRFQEPMASGCIAVGITGVDYDTIESSLSNIGSHLSDRKHVTSIEEAYPSVSDKGHRDNIISLPKTKKPKCQLVAGNTKWLLEEDELPHFSQVVYDYLPPFLHRVMACCEESDDRDMVLMGSLTCISATLHNVCGKYDRNIWFPMLYFFVMAEAGMGKGALTYCRQLVSPINKQLRETSEQQIREFKEEIRQVKQDGGHVSGEEPKRRTLFIPTNSSASAFVEQLDNNDGIGLLFDTECDTLSSVLKSDFGDYSSYLRKAYHHEPIEISRRKDNEFRCIEQPKLALCLSGTPEQLHTLTPDAENGLYSRILTYHIPFKADFRDTLVEDFPSDDAIISSMHDRFYQFGQEYKRMREAFFRGGDYVVVIPQHLCTVFNKHFREVNQQTVDDISNAMQGIVRRIAFAVFRIMMVLTAIRFMDDNPNPSALSRSGKSTRLICSDEDFHIAMEIGNVLTYHSVYCYAHLPKTISSMGTGGRILGKHDKMNTLLDSLPDSFDKAQYRSASIALNFPPNTTAKWIKDFIIAGAIERDSKDHYRKTCSSSASLTNVHSCAS